MVDPPSAYRSRVLWSATPYGHVATSANILFLEGAFSEIRTEHVRLASYRCGESVVSEEAQSEMSIFPTKILLATDGSKEAELVARTATKLADKTGSELHVVHVFGITPWYPVYPDITDFDETELEDPVLEEDLQRSSEQRARELLDAEVEKIRLVGGAPAQPHLLEGAAPQEIVGLAEEIGAGLIVMGSRGRGGIRRALMGSVSDSVVRHAHCPVLVVRPEKERSAEHEADFLT
jgi:nucleotide-binding universal stress UspA family protein